QFAKKHRDCLVGDGHFEKHEHENEHNHDHDHDHPHSSTPMQIRRESAKLSPTGIALGYIIYRKLGNKQNQTPPELEFFGTLITIGTGYQIFKSGLKTLNTGKKFTDDTLISTAVIASLLMREAITGLSVVWLINLGRLLESITLHRSRN